MEEEIKQKIDEMLEQETKAPSEIIQKDADKAVVNYQKDGIDIIKDKVAKGEMDIDEAGKQLANLMITSEAMQNTEDNQKFIGKFKETKQDELLASAQKSLAKEEADKILAQQEKNEAFYISYRAILEFDLEYMLHKKPKQEFKKVWDPKLGKKVKVPVEKDEQEEVEEPRPKHTYEERSYGIPLMIMMLCVLTVPYFACVLVLAIFNAINYIFEAISRFSKPALIICTGIAGVTMVGLFIYVVILCIQAAFNVQIIPEGVQYTILNS